jgi:hypothetical protein
MGLGAGADNKGLPVVNAHAIFVCILQDRIKGF